MPKRNCGTCRYWDGYGNGKPTRSGNYRCLFPVVLPPLPDAVTLAVNWLPRATVAMGKHDGVSCPTWETRANGRPQNADGMTEDP